jgi:hypothetical protein
MPKSGSANHAGLESCRLSFANRADRVGVSHAPLGIISGWSIELKSVGACRSVEVRAEVDWLYYNALLTSVQLTTFHHALM